MEWLLLIGCLGSGCSFGSTQISLPTEGACTSLREIYQGQYAVKGPSYFSVCRPTANLYSPKDVGAFSCAMAVDAGGNKMMAISVPCIGPQVGSQR